MRSSAWAGVSASSTCSAPRQAAIPASTSRFAPAPGGSERTARTAPPETKNAFCQPGSIAGAIRQSSSLRRRSSRRRRSIDVLEGLDPVSQPGRLLVAQALGEIREPCSEPRQRAALVEPLELLRGARGERARCQGGPATARDRPERARLLRDHEVLAPPPQVQPVLRPAPARVGRWLELADQPHLLERRLELGAEDAPLDPRRARAVRPRPTVAGDRCGNTSGGARAGRGPDRRTAPGRGGRERGRCPACSAHRAPGAACRRPAACAEPQASVARRAGARPSPGRARSGGRAPRPSPRHRAARGGTAGSGRRRNGPGRRGRPGAGGLRAAAARAPRCRAEAPRGAARAAPATAAPGSAGRSGRCARRAASSPAKARKRSRTR